MAQLYLASNSPRRLAILQQLGLSVEKLNSEIDETPYPNEPANTYCLRIALAKNQAAQAVRNQQNLANLPILTADTTVSLQGQILGKPASKADAERMLKQLSGNTHQVFTAVCVSIGETQFHCLQSSEVTFKPLSDVEIAAYIASGEPLDKAGAYGIQGLGGCFVSHLNGSFSGVMGLPVYETAELLRRCGISLLTK